MEVLIAKLKEVIHIVNGRSSTQSGQFPDVIHPDDTFLVSYPRSGMAWLRRLIACMQHPGLNPGVGNIGDYVPDVYQERDVLDSQPRPRIMKSHEIYDARYPRVIYLLRDGRDVGVSYYNYYQTIKGYKGDFRGFLVRFLNGNVSFGSWQDHVRSWLLREHGIPLIYVRYEHLHSVPFKTLYDVADFLRFDVDDHRIATALKKCTFKKHRQDVKRNSPNFEQGYRGGVKGAPGAWKETFTEALLSLFWAEAGEVAAEVGYERSGN